MLTNEKSDRNSRPPILGHTVSDDQREKNDQSDALYEFLVESPTFKPLFNLPAMAGTLQWALLHEGFSDCPELSDQARIIQETAKALPEAIVEFLMKNGITAKALHS